MKNNKGVTIVELVVSITILLIVVTFLFQIIISLKEIYNSSGIKTELLTKQAIISKMINSDFNSKKLELASSCGENCISFYFKDGTTKTLEMQNKTDSSPAYLIYGDYKTELSNNSTFGSKTIKYYTITSASKMDNDSILEIDIPIVHSQFKNYNFGINIVYQYNSNKTSVTNLAINDNNNADALWLAGSSNMVWYTSVDFVDPGYYYLDTNNNLIKETESTDVVKVNRSPISNNQMTITYVPVGNEDKRVTRTVTFIESDYTYKLNNSYYEFVAPTSGDYKIQLWGASGASSTNAKGGNGAYTEGIINLKIGEKLYVYVGGTGSGDKGGYNGGGSLTNNQSSLGGAAGGGATDIRLKNGNWNSSDSLKSRIMVASGGAGASLNGCGTVNKAGGAGGDISSESFVKGSNCSDSMFTLALGANQTIPGVMETYSTSGQMLQSYVSGDFGMSFTPTGYEGDIRSGGGGGYYGGASSGYGSPATGGSSFVSGCDGCIAIKSDGKIANTNIHYSGKTFKNITMVSGNNLNSSLIKPNSDDNGYAKISLVGLSNI